VPNFLDNPIFNALTTVDSEKNIGSSSYCYLDKAVAPFIGMESWDKKSQQKMINEVPADRSWFLLIKDAVEFIDEINVTLSMPLFQFHCPGKEKVPVMIDDKKIVPLDKSKVDEMIALTKLTNPGPFRERTIEFGNYHGIFENGKLMAMGGERLHLPGMTEISAICTHPDAQGKGYGNMIVNFLTHDLFKKEQIPFLHVKTENESAIKIYERQGYEIRERIMFYVFRKAEG
jgi:GNAT superfamily N-acetyltransferase